jgi:DNA-binding transcriptional LysR family regulator
LLDVRCREKKKPPGGAAEMLGTSEQRQLTTEAAQIFDVTMFANTNVAVRAAVESGGGFTVLPDFAVRSRLESGSLIRLLDKWSLPSGDIQAIMPAGRHQSAVARMLFSSLQTLLRQAAQ